MRIDWFRCRQGGLAGSLALAAGLVFAVPGTGASPTEATGEPSSPAAVDDGGASGKPESPAEGTPTPPESASKLPNGYGGARFGMSKEEVKALFPEATLMRDMEHEAEFKAATATSMPPLALLEISDREVLGLKGCKVGFQFAADQLYFIHANCGSDKEVLRTLQVVLGPHSHEVTDALYWHDGGYSVSLNRKSLRFAFIDRAMDQRVQKAMAKAIIEQRVREAGGSAAPAEAD